MADPKTYNLEAIYLAKEINLAKTAEKLDQNIIGKRREFLTYVLGPQENLFVFSYGAVVFVNVAKENQAAIKRSLNRFLVNPVRRQYDESYTLKDGAKGVSVGDDVAEVPAVGPSEIEIAARILAQSVALDYTEDLADEIFSNVGAMNTELENSGRFLKDTRSLLQLFAQNSSIIQFVVSKLSLLDSPDITWEHRNLELLFSQLADMFELRRRFRNVEYKIKFARDYFEFAVTALQGRRESFLELVIIVLIAIDIILYFFGG